MADPVTTPLPEEKTEVVRSPLILAFFAKCLNQPIILGMGERQAEKGAPHRDRGEWLRHGGLEPAHSRVSEPVDWRRETFFRAASHRFPNNWQILENLY
jgi:hypothetical protein